MKLESLKILCVHNYYGSSAPSGENIVFETETELLKRHGHEVVNFLRHSDEIRARGVIGTVHGALSTPWNPWSAAAIRHEVDCFRPDVVHVHNTFPLLSPAIFHTIGHRAARVLTLHNYRLFCPAAIPMRAGRVCTECLDRKSSWPALRHGCYRGRRLATAPLAFSVSLHRRIGTWARHVDAFIALSEFQQKLMVEAGLPSDRVHVKPNFFAGHPQPSPWGQRGKYVVFAGRLSIEKGVEGLIRAWLKWGESAPELRILGDGPLRESLQKMASSLPGVRIRFLGQLPAVVAERQIAEAQLLVLPSVCFEGFPMVIREAFAYGTPAAVSDIGPLPSIVRDGVSGVVFGAGDTESLFHTVSGAWATPGLLETLGEGARAEFATLYNENANYDMLMAIYAAAMDRRTK
jgi:glycosyltransferase involved in cell wall biosynthesis